MKRKLKPKETMKMPNNERFGASFRDLSGFLFSRGGILYRQINPSYAADYDLLMSSGLYDKLVRAGLLVPHQRPVGFLCFRLQSFGEHCSRETSPANLRRHLVGRSVPGPKKQDVAETQLRLARNVRSPGRADKGNPPNRKDDRLCFSHQLSYPNYRRPSPI